MDKLITILLSILPQHLLSRFVGMLASSQLRWIRMPFMRWFACHYKVDLSIAERSKLTDYDSFNDFFTRALKLGVRAIDQDQHSIISPVDGCVSQIARVDDGELIQAKGKTFSVQSLLGGDETLSEPFNHGSFTTLYLAPKDYHRIHMPFTGTLRRMICIPGKLFSVNHASVNHVDQLFARNERVACVFDTNIGPMAVVLVGAMLVASIKVSWDGVLMPSRPRKITFIDYSDKNIVIEKGEELGRFLLGSTVILLFNDQMNWLPEFKTLSTVQMGQAIGITKRNVD